MPCNWLLDVIISQPCKGYSQETKSSFQLCVPCGQGKERAYKYYKQSM
ncbi:5_t:CDS:2 [Cetraspora pellucida]|uniref:5_t:CDS:1 n=1 Tax=Cetraspora pellucida TaxID=1433469 RepID=A0ACA9LBB5_9GLOM|nr:5_t:CDS:2 [Cetraspora pellucida]